MSSLKISEIKDANLRRVAERIDNGDNVLISNELPIFMIEAAKSGIKHSEVAKICEPIISDLPKPFNDYSFFRCMLEDYKDQESRIESYNKKYKEFCDRRDKINKVFKFVSPALCYINHLTESINFSMNNSRPSGIAEKLEPFYKRVLRDERSMPTALEKYIIPLPKGVVIE